MPEGEQATKHFCIQCAECHDAHDDFSWLFWWLKKLLPWPDSIRYTCSAHRRPPNHITGSPGERAFCHFTNIDGHCKRFRPKG